MKKEVLNNIFEQFSKTNVLIIGDVMLDAYTEGTVNRISPEAPVPVIDKSSYYGRLGGAANVALNIKALGGNPVLCSVIGDAKQDKDFTHAMKCEGLSTHGILHSEERILTVKHRILANKQQLLRIDNEITTPLSIEDEERFLKHLKQIIDSQSIDVVIFEDYDKGVITPRIIDEMVKIAIEKNIPITVDPKKRNFLHYNSTTIFKPNLKELQEGCKDFEQTDLQSIIKHFMQKKQHQCLLLTLSEEGVLICEKQENDFVFTRIPAHVRNIADVSGAGDTVISVAALCLATGMSFNELANLANLAGGLVCEEVGVVAINKEKFANEILNVIL